MKKFNINKRLLFLIYVGIKSIPPKQYSDVEEMKIISNIILPNFEKLIPEIIKLDKETIMIATDFSCGLIEEEEYKKNLLKANKDLNLGLKKKENEIVEVSLENEEFKKLHDIYSNQGKMWFRNLEDFLEVDSILDLSKKK